MAHDDDDQADEVQAHPRTAARDVLLAQADARVRPAAQHPGEAGQGAQRRLHRHRPGSHHRRHLLRASEGRLHLPAAPRPRVVPDEGRRAARDDVADVRKGHRVVQGPRLGAAQRRQRAGDLRQHEHARREPAGRRRPRPHLQDGEDRQRRRRVLRRGRQQHRRFPRGAELRRRPAAADRLRLREQSLRLFGAGRKEHGDRRRGGPGGELRLRRRLDQRQRRAGGLSVHPGRARARAQRRGADAHRVQDVPMARPLRARQGVLSDRRRAGDVEEPRSDSDVHDLSPGAQRAERRTS